MREFSTTDIRLAAFLLAQISEASFEIPETSAIKKSVIIRYPTQFEPNVNQLVRQFIDRRGVVDLYQYNLFLNRIRDEIKKRTNN